MTSAELTISLLIIPCVLLICSIICNLAGIHYLLWKKNAYNFTNQRMLLLNLSLVEILSCIAMLIYWSDGYFKFCSLVNITTSDSMTTACHLLFAIDWYFYIMCLMSPMTLLLDRFIGVTFPLTYRIIFPKERAILTILAQWMTIIVLVSQIVFLDQKLWLKYMQCSALTIELLVLSFATLTYSWIAYKVRRQGVIFDRRKAESPVSKVASLIILTYLCFVVLPELALLIMIKLHSKNADIYQKIFYTITCINYVCDPLIYILGYGRFITSCK